VFGTPPVIPDFQVTNNVSLVKAFIVDGALNMVSIGGPANALPIINGMQSSISGSHFATASPAGPYP
jgi:hypothetical protein